MILYFNNISHKSELKKEGGAAEGGGLGWGLETVKHVEGHVWAFHFVNIKIRIRGMGFWKSFFVMFPRQHSN